MAVIPDNQQEIAELDSYERGYYVQPRAQHLLRQMLGSDAEFRSGQLEAIEALVVQRKRLLVVQRTGWGKSLVYFLATRLLRDQGMGPTLLISPLLSLMRNQIEAAGRIGVRAATLNSSNVEEWTQVEVALRAGTVDALLVSPVDDIVDSRWTLTVCGALLQEAGSGPVFPVALATAASGGGTD